MSITKNVQLLGKERACEREPPSKPCPLLAKMPCDAESDWVSVSDRPGVCFPICHAAITDVVRCKNNIVKELCGDI